MGWRRDAMLHVILLLGLTWAQCCQGGVIDEGQGAVVEDGGREEAAVVNVQDGLRNSVQWSLYQHVFQRLAATQEQACLDAESCGVWQDYISAMASHPIALFCLRTTVSLCFTVILNFTLHPARPALYSMIRHACLFCSAARSSAFCCRHCCCYCRRCCC